MFLIQNSGSISPTSRPIIDSSNACNQASDPVVFRCMDRSNSQLLGILGLSGTCFSQTFPLLRGSSPHETHCSSGQVHSSSQTASRSVQLFLYEFQVLCCTIHSQWGKPKIAPSLWDFVNQPEEDRSTVIGKLQK